MGKIKDFIWILMIIFLISCNNEKEATTPSGEYLVVTQEIIENYNDGSISKEIINYIYEQDSDIFWKKAEFLDSSGKIYKTITREFDAKRFPIKEISDDGTGVNEVYIVEYSPQNYELLSRIEYEGGLTENNKIRAIKYKYDTAGYLISEESIKFSRDSAFTNVEGNKIEEYMLIQPLLPNISRPKGNFLIAEDYTLLKMFLTKKMKEKTSSELPVGSLYFTVEQKINENNIPEYSKVTRPSKSANPEPNLPEEEWYEIEYDGLGNLLTLTGYSKQSKDSSSDENVKNYYEYDDAGIVKSIKQYKYNPLTKEYDLLHNSREFKWIDPKIKSPKNFIDYSLNEERTCYHRKIYSAFSKNIEKYDSTEKIVTYSECSYPLDKKPDKPELKLTKKVTYKFRKINIKQN